MRLAHLNPPRKIGCDQGGRSRRLLYDLGAIDKLFEERDFTYNIDALLRCSSFSFWRVLIWVCIFTKNSKKAHLSILKEAH